MRFPVLALAVLFFVGCTPAGLSVAEKERASEEVTSFWEDGEWEISSRVLWTYARPNAEPTIVLNQSWTDGEWMDVSKETWRVDDRGLQTEGVMVEWSEGAWSVRARMQYAYDDDGNKVMALRETVDPAGNASRADSLASTFGREGYETHRRFFRWTDERWVEGLRQSSEYDAEGRETTRLHLTPGEAGWMEQRRWTFSYGPDGHIQAALVEQMEDGAWTPWLNQTYTYDGAGSRTAIVHEEWTGAAWKRWMRNETRYTSPR